MIAPLSERLRGHLYTLLPFVGHVLAPRPVPESGPWQLTLNDALHGQVRLTGRLHARPGAGGILVVIHGLGGSVASHYVGAAVRAALGAGLSCLRVNLRGADRSGEDFYHAGLSSDLAAVVDSLANHGPTYLLGYSLGGHIALRFATETRDPRVRAVAAVCSPLDLDRCAREIDRHRGWVYRRHVLGGLREMYAAYAARRGPIVPLEAAARIATIREWDERIVARRHGFRDAAHYYAEASVAPRLPELAIPALLVASEHDPMVPAHTLRPALARATGCLEVRWIAGGGHVGFPASVELEPWIVGWLLGRP